MFHIERIALYNTICLNVYTEFTTSDDGIGPGGIAGIVITLLAMIVIITVIVITVVIIIIRFDVDF